MALTVNSTIIFLLLTGLGVVAALVSSRASLWRTYAISKAVASAGFIGTALTSGAMDSGWGRLALIALVLSAAGDVALALRSKKAFLVGLSCFALAHATYTVAFSVYGASGTTLLITAPIVALAAGWAWRSYLKRVPESVRVPVAVYAFIISVMLVLGFGSGITHRAWLLVIGVILVAGSDIAVGRQRFGRPMFANKLIGLPAYYVGQTLIALSLAGS